MSLLATTQEAAETKFWRMPELIEKLLEYLDELSILSIVGVNLLAVEVLQTASKTSDILSKLIRKVLGFDQPQIFQHQREKVERLTTTLLAMLDRPEPLLLEVLDVICAEHEHGRVRDPPHYTMYSTNYNLESVIRISCPLHTDHHYVTPLGFILLETVEAALAIASTKQRVIQIVLNGREDMADARKRCYYPALKNDMREALLSALVSRMARQEVSVETLAWHRDYVDVNSANLAVFSGLLQRCDQLLHLRTVKVRRELGVEGWGTLALAMQRHLACKVVFYTSRGWMLQARREHLRAIWEALPMRPNGTPPSCWTVEGRVSANLRFKKTEEKSEDTWMELLEFLDHPEPEEVDKRLRSGRGTREG